MKMKKTTKFLLGGSLVILFLTPVSQVKADWHQDNVGWWYSLNDGSYYKNTEAKINEKWYKFDDRGYMMTGWQLIWERNDSNYGIIKNWSYFDPVNGDKKQGWQNIDGKWYYLTKDGALVGDQNIDGKKYYFDPVNGDMKTGWRSEQQNSNTIWNYFDPESGAKVEGWKNIDGKWYYFPKYYHAVTGFWSIDGKDYYFDPINCDMQTGWVSKQYHYGTEKLYFDPVSGAKVEGWQEIDGKKYYFGWNGALRNHRKIDGKDYYFDPDTCELKIGWFEALGNKYYADPNDGGALASNKTLIIDGISYTFDYNCILINNAP